MLLRIGGTRSDMLSFILMSTKVNKLYNFTTVYSKQKLAEREALNQN